MPDQTAKSEQGRGDELTASGRLLQLGPADSGLHPGVNTSRRIRKRQRMPGLAMLPTALTLGNAISGIASLIELAKAYAAVISGDEKEVFLRLGYAALLIGAGMLCDALDGKVARMTATTGRFGAELDSLCDAVTFGVVPALMIRVAGDFFFAHGSAFEFDTKILWAVSGLYACCAILRLARYNVETDEEDDHTSFRGLPSPAAAASIAGFVLGLSWLRNQFEWFGDEPWTWILRVLFPLVCMFVGVMMVTRIRYSHLFNKLVTRKQSLRTMVAFLVLLTLVVILGDYWRLTVPALMLAYVLSGPIYFGYRVIRGRGLLGRRLALAERKRRRDERAAKQTPS
ncbi:MAG: CDP-alcohol phosphatidyltransferase family protein [Planctomycetes bacterium]|nr:CDP-alcohol phosphatidyltransferase family protein [Planctomycetota bacterium]